MIYILTVHWEHTDWIEIQLKYIERFIDEPHKKFAFLNVPTHRYDEHFDYASHEPIKRHASKLNMLKDMACFDSQDDNDLLIFLDGDAFPVAPFLSSVRKDLETHVMVAVQRAENLGDCQPHPCFCVTTVGFCKQHNVDWNPGGARWQDINGKSITDLGGRVLKLLDEQQHPWKKLLRSNARNLHPLHYGVYGDMVYHHGAGFRNPATRTDLNIANRKKIRTMLYQLTGKILPHQTNKKWFRPMNEVVKKNQAMSQVVFDYLQQDPDFFAYFLGHDEQCDFALADRLLGTLETIK